MVTVPKTKTIRVTILVVWAKPSRGTQKLAAELGKPPSLALKLVGDSGGIPDVLCIDS